jgi:hypothetical protein
MIQTINKIERNKVFSKSIGLINKSKLINNHQEHGGKQKRKNKYEKQVY